MSENTLRDSRRKKFFMVDNDTIDAYGAKIGVYGFAVYSLLLRYAGSSDTAFPSYQTIGEKFGFSERQAMRTVGQLVAVGLIEKTTRYAPNGATTSNLYTLVDIPPYDSQSPPPMTHSHPPYDCESPYKEPSIKTQSKKTSSTRVDDSKTNQPTRALAEPANNGLVGSALPNQQQVEQLSPATATAIQATAAPPLPEHPPAPPGPASSDEQRRSFALLTDSEIGLSASKALTHATEHDLPWLVYQVATWWDDYQAGNVAGAGALSNRISGLWQSDEPSKAFLASDLYRRHYPLPPDRLAEWAAWRSSACAMEALLQKGYDEDFALGLVDQHEPPPWLDELPPDVRALLDALPVPEVQP